MDGQLEFETPKLSGDSERLPRWLIFALIPFAGIVLFYNLGSCRTFGSHEVFAAVPAREMIRSNDWIVPKFGGLPRLKKPPLAYWVVATSATVFGRLDEWSARFPAACSALLLSLVLGYWGWKRYGKIAGIASGIVQLTSIYVILFERKAEIDMMLCLFTTVAIFLISEHGAEHSRKHQFWRWTAIYTFISLSWLAKFHFGPAMIVAPVVIYFVLEKRFRELKCFFHPVGLVLFVAAVVIWPYFVLQQVPDAWSVWKTETMGRAVGELGRQPVWFYIPNILWLTLPWTPFALWAIPQSFRRAWKEHDSHERFLWIWFLANFAIVTISAEKHKHYIMSALPVFSLLAGQSLQGLVRKIRDGEFRISPRLTILHAVFVVAGMSTVDYFAEKKYPYLHSAIVFFCVTMTVGSVLGVWLMQKKRYQFSLGLTLVTSSLGLMIFMQGILPARDHSAHYARFSQRIRNKLISRANVTVYKLGQSSVVYYLNDPVTRSESLEDLKTRLRENGILQLVTMEMYLPELATLGKLQIVESMKGKKLIPKLKHPPLVLIDLERPPQMTSEKPDRRQ